MSHPSRVRGLKYVFLFYSKYTNAVAPLAGAWIEIVLALESLKARLSSSHPSRVRGLKSL